MKETISKTIYVKGMWHQGLVAAAVWAKEGFRVVGLCDTISEMVSLNAGHLPVFEPGLLELLRESLDSGTLSFEIVSEDLPLPDYLCFMHDTEVDDDDHVSIEKFLRDVEIMKPLIHNSVQILVTSQLPPGTCDHLLKDLQQSLGYSPNFAYMPENLRLGKAIDRFRNPPLPVFGLNRSENLSELTLLFPNTLKFESCSLVEAELLKSSLNVFLAISVTFGNEISEICDNYGADGSKVMSLLRLESRIGNQLPLLPGMPFSGGTLGRDVRNLEQAPTSNPSGLIKSIWQSNHHRGNYLIEVIRQTGLANSFKKIGLLGLTYKTDTSTLRRSYPLEVFAGVKEDFDLIAGFDPMSSAFKEELPKELTLFESLNELFGEVELLVITTPWQEIIDFFVLNGLGEKHLIDPFGVLTRNFKDKLNYHHFGGKGSSR